MGYDIVHVDGLFWIVDSGAEEYISGGFLTLEQAERELAAYEYTEPPENDLEP